MFLKIVSPRGKYKDDNTYENIVRYCLRKDKVLYPFCCGTFNMDLETAAEEMKELAIKYKKMKGTRIRHMILVFNPEKESHIDNLSASLIAQEICLYYADMGYQLLFAVHEDKPYLHAHIIMNTVRITDGKKYKGDKLDYYNLIKYVKTILKDYDLKLSEVIYSK